MGEEATSSAKAGRRDFIKKAAYVAPAILTLAVAPAYVKAGSQKPPRRRQGNQDDQGEDEQ